MASLNFFLQSRLPRGAVGERCRVCSNMLETARGIEGICSRKGYRHHNKKECQRNAKRGCVLCKVIFEHGWMIYERGGDGTYVPLRPSFLDTWTMPGSLYFFCQKSDAGINDGLPNWGTHTQEKRSLHGVGWLVGRVLSMTRVRDKYWSRVITFALLTSEDDPAGYYLPRRVIVDTYTADHIMDGIGRWIKDCLAGRHDDCVYLEKPKLPTRVLDVGDKDSTIVVLYPAKAEEREDYVTLSYCWGGPQPVTTTKSNFNKLMSGIEVSILPQTLQDAVWVTRHLGFRYLWIDALCIIQNDDQDKAKEIGKMGMIYRNSTVTIAASHSRSASGGFLKPDLTRCWTTSCTVPIHVPNSDRTGKVTLALEHGGVPPNQPLLTRGWAFQEAVLSPRIVAFSEFEVYCECSKPSTAKLFNSGSVRRHPIQSLCSPDSRTFNDIQRYRQKDGEGWMDVKYLALTWEEMVAKFTLRALTLPDDRLPCVQGLASELMSHLGNNVDTTYVAGTWTGCLPQLLLWTRNNTPTLDWTGFDADGNPTQVMHQLKRSTRAPSWSWASLDCPVMFTSDEGDRYEATVSILTGPSAPRYSAIDTSQPAAPVTAVLEMTCEMLYRNMDEFAQDQSSGAVRITMDLDEGELEQDRSVVYYMLLCRNVGPQHWGLGFRPAGPFLLWYVSGLVVEEIEGNLFRRLGYFRWDLSKPETEKHSFGSRRSVRLI